jgi:hypothetical protein
MKNIMQICLGVALVLGLATINGTGTLESSATLGVRLFTSTDSVPITNFAASLYTASGLFIDSAASLSSNAVLFHNVSLDVPPRTDELPNGFRLEQNYPNPFNPTTRIVFSIPEAGPVHLRTYTILGQLDASLDVELEAGTHEVEYEPGGAAGVIFYSLITKTRNETRKMVNFGGPKGGRSSLRLLRSLPGIAHEGTDLPASITAADVQLRLHSLPVTYPEFLDTIISLRAQQSDTMVTLFARQRVDMVPPVVSIVYSLRQSPSPSETLFVLDRPTATWRGVSFTFRGVDVNGLSLAYSWRVDSNAWTPFTSSTSALITGTLLDAPRTGRHLFEVRARNNRGIESIPDTHAVASFNTVYPEFLRPGAVKSVLLVNVNKHPAVNTLTRSNRPDSEIMLYYKSIFDSLGIPADTFNTRWTGHPGLSLLSRYSTVYIITDNPPPGDPGMIIPSLVYMNYLRAGGTMMMNAVGWTVYPSILISPESLLVTGFRLHDLSLPYYGGSYCINREYDCAGAFGENEFGYPGLQIDPAKSDPDTGMPQSSCVVAGGGIRRLYTCLPNNGADIIYSYDSKVDSVLFEHQPLGIRYIGPTYRTVWFGIPLFYVKRDQAGAAIHKGMEDLGYPF